MFSCDGSVRYFQLDSVILISGKQTFEHIPKWIQDIRDNRGDEIEIYLCGNKADLEDARKVTSEEAEKFASENSLHYSEVSAKSGDKIHLTFDTITKKLAGKEGPPTERKKGDDIKLGEGDKKKDEEGKKGCC